MTLREFDRLAIIIGVLVLAGCGEKDFYDNRQSQQPVTLADDENLQEEDSDNSEQSGNNQQPVITLAGPENVQLAFGQPYQELGATGTDPEDGDISGNIVIDSTAVNPLQAGTYTVTYNLADSEGLAAAEVTRTITVLQNQPPAITLLGPSPMTLNVNDSYQEPGATAADPEDGDISDTIVIDASALDTTTEGAYTVTYDVSDGHGLPATQVTRTVNVVAPTSASCTGQTGSAVAIGFRYVTARNASRPTMLAATSEHIEFNEHLVSDYPNVNWSRRYKSYKVGNGGGAIAQWILASEPLNGVLYEAGTPLAQDDIISDPDDLMYVPNEDFIGQDTFFYCVADATGLSNTAQVDITVADPANYPLPLGILNPGFGIDEQPPADPGAWPGAEAAGFYYIDGSDPDCSDANTYGYPDVPRCTFTSGTTIEGGKKMVVAGAVSLRDFSWHLLDFTGSAGNTAWLVGDDRAAVRPVITANPARASGMALRLTGGYFRISGMTFDGLDLNHRGVDESATSTDQIAIRHSEVKNFPSTNRGGTTIGLSTEGTGVLVLNVYAHDNGIVDETLAEERDIHAFSGSDQTGFWMLDISCSENAGDCIQLLNNNTSQNVYIGRMAGHSEGENCIDIKDYHNVVVSESDCWDLRRVQYGNSGSTAQAFYVNDEGVQQGYAWFLNNRSWDTGGAHFAASNVGGRVYFIGNRAFFGPADGINFGGGGGERHALFNTLVGALRGIYHFGTGSANGRYIAGNAVIDATAYQTRLQSTTNVIDVLDYNFYSASGGVFATGGSTPTEHIGLAVFNANTGFEDNGAEAVSALFADPEIYDFSVDIGSGLVDVIPADFINSLSAIGDLQNDLGISLQDYNDTTRPVNTLFDAGADEAGSN